MGTKKQMSERGRPPVVVVLGHVDHGKTTLLDYIRKTRFQAKEKGGITQTTGAYQVRTKEGKKITFIDTPGHAAFAAMRARGAKVADIAVLVVAADDGVMPQTKESLSYIKEVGLPLVVAITKVDKANVEPDKVRGQLAEEEVLVEGWGGNVPVVEVSGVTGQGVEELLTTISLLSEVEGVSGGEDEELEAVVVEAGQTRGRGAVATVVVKRGVLRVGETVVGGGVQGKVRGMFDGQGKGVKEAGPGVPVEVMGWEEVPEAGSTVLRAKDGKQRGEGREEKVRGKGKGEEKKGLPIVVKADTVGGLEAVMGQMPGEVTVLLSGVGEVTETDVKVAAVSDEEDGPPSRGYGEASPPARGYGEASPPARGYGEASPPRGEVRRRKGIVVGFRVKVKAGVAELAREEGVEILKFDLIYELLEEVERRVLKWLSPTIDEEVLGEAEIIAEFPFDDKRVAGCRVRQGRVSKGDRLHLKREGEVLGNCKIASMRQVKDEVDKVEKGEEVGILITPQLDFKAGDMLVSFKV